MTDHKGGIMCEVCEHPDRGEIERLLAEKRETGSQCPYCLMTLHSRQGLSSHIGHCPRRLGRFTYQWTAFAEQYDVSWESVKRHFDVCMIDSVTIRRKAVGTPAGLMDAGLEKVAEDLEQFRQGRKLMVAGEKSAAKQWVEKVNGISHN